MYFLINSLVYSRRAAPEQSFYGTDGIETKELKYFEQLGKPLRHIYQIYNDGPWHANDVIININWPLKYTNEETGKDDWLLYLTEKPNIESMFDYFVIYEKKIIQIFLFLNRFNSK